MVDCFLECISSRIFALRKGPLTTHHLNQTRVHQDRDIHPGLYAHPRQMQPLYSKPAGFHYSFISDACHFLLVTETMSCNIFFFWYSHGFIVKMFGDLAHLSKLPLALNQAPLICHLWPSWQCLSLNLAPAAVINSIWILTNFIRHNLGGFINHSKSLLIKEKRWDCFSAVTAALITISMSFTHFHVPTQVHLLQYPWQQLLLSALCLCLPVQIKALNINTGLRSPVKALTPLHFLIWASNFAHLS